MSQFDETQTIVFSMSTTQGDMPSTPNDKSNLDDSPTNTKKDDESSDGSADSSDFTQRSLLQSRQRSAQLKLESSSGLKMNKVRAETYFISKVEAQLNREKREKQIKLKNAQRKRKRERLTVAAREYLGLAPSSDVKTPSKAKKKTPVSSSLKTTPASKKNKNKNNTTGNPPPKHVTPFTVRSQVVSSTVRSQVEDGVTETPSNQICDGCGHEHDKCHEIKYRNFCLHSVLDYFEEVGMNYITQHGTYLAFLRAYTVALKKDMLESTKYYEINIDCELPVCMERGSLEDAQQIHRCNRIFQALMAQRVRDVSSYVEDFKAGRVVADCEERNEK